MDDTQTKLLAALWEKSKHCLSEAEDLFEHGHFEGTVSRAYYAAFHAAQAALVTEGLAAETHHGVLTLFSLHFVKPGKFDPKFKSTLRELKEKRQSSDYDAYAAIESEEAETSLRKAQGFIASLEKYLAQYLDKSSDLP